jgi:hypothetical protein
MQAPRSLAAALAELMCNISVPVDIASVNNGLEHQNSHPLATAERRDSSQADR